MIIRVDSKAPLPLVEQVRRGVRRAIAEKAVAPGDELPPVRQLAGDLGINLNTVARAYRELEREGLVTTARGRGTVVVARRTTRPVKPAALRAQLRDLLADAKLSGYSARAVRRLVLTEVERSVPARGRK